MDINEGSFFAYILVQILVSFAIFAIGYFIARYAVNKIGNGSYFKSKLFNLGEYLPEEEISELNQIFYLFMIVLFALNILYLVFFWKGDSYTFLILDIVLSLYLAINLDKNSKMYYLKLFLLIPFASISILLFGGILLSLDLFHAGVFLYFMKVYFEKFMDYSETNSLGIAILLLFLIVFISFLFTILVENVYPLDSLVMVSNAFTSNGYAILGKSNVGKVNEIFLVWSGFILSGVGTATLTLEIVRRHIDDEFDRLEEKIKKNKKD